MKNVADYIITKVGVSFIDRISDDVLASLACFFITPIFLIAKCLSARQLILQHRLQSWLVFIYIYIYMAIVSHTQECNYQLV